jgi:hypothetical protein
MGALQVLSALLTPLLGVIATAVLVYQYLLQRLRWRLDLWEKRYPVYLATVDYIAFAVQNVRMPIDEVLKFKRESMGKDFLFGTDVQTYLEQLYQKGLELEKFALSLIGVPEGDRRNRIVDQQLDLVKWFQRQFEVSKDLFGEYLKISKK